MKLLFLSFIAVFSLGYAARSRHHEYFSGDYSDDDDRKVIFQPAAVSTGIISTAQEVSILKDLYDSTNGTGWHFRSPLNCTKYPVFCVTKNSSELPGIFVDDDEIGSDRFNFTHNVGAVWNFTGIHNPCTENWQGIGCTCAGGETSSGMNFVDDHISNNSINCTITSIYLRQFNMRGELPSSLSNLTNLQAMNLGKNHLFGVIPLFIQNMSSLVLLHLRQNIFNGTIPAFLSMLVNLRSLRLDNNILTGTIPPELFDLQRLQLLNLSANLLQGTIPHQVGNAVQLSQLALMYNNLNGTLPHEIGQLVELRGLFLSKNKFTGTIPSEFSLLYNLNYLYIGSNHLTGTLPQWLDEFGVLLELGLNDNSFYGSLSESFCKLTKITVLTLNVNHLSGSLPNCISDMESIALLWLFNNSFTGTLPQTMSTMPYMSFLLLHNNNFRGPIPTLQNMPYLRFVNLLNNEFTGPLNGIFGEEHAFLSYVDVSSNQFTGPIPRNVFNNQRLNSFSAASNCLTGAIPINICSLPQLQFLNLDGVSSATSCRNQILPDFVRINSYILRRKLSSDIPTCLFNMRSLETLHMSGNGISWRLPSDLNVSVVLQDLSLSHNYIFGVISDSIQNRPWKSLDLSYNKLGGTLNHNITAGGDSELYVNVNRLSGNIPPKLKYAEHISIVESNLFYCDFGKTQVPHHDPNTISYECGSTTFLMSFMIWSVLLGIVVFVVMSSFIIRKFGKEDESSVQIVFNAARKCASMYTDFMSVFQEDRVDPTDSYDNNKCKDLNPNSKETDESAAIRASDSHQTHDAPPQVHQGVRNFGVYLKNIRKTFLAVTCRILIVFVPLYCVLSAFFNTHTHEYAWYVSAIYLSGVVPAMVLFTFFSIFVLLLKFGLLNRILVRTAPSKLLNQLTTEQQWKRVFALTIVVLINLVVMLTFNGVFVLYILKLSQSTVILLEIVVAGVKVFWSRFAVRWLMQRARQFYLNQELSELAHMNDTRDMPLLSSIVIFNSIVGPFIANAFVSKSCFNDIFNNARTVTSDFPYHACPAISDPQLRDSLCPTSSEWLFQMSYQPPFAYRYKCSSAFVRNYAGVYVKMFIIEAFIMPMVQILLKVVYEYCHYLDNTDGLVYDFARTSMNRLLHQSKRLPEYASSVLFQKDVFVLSAISTMSTLLTFGVVFPPLGVIALFTLISHIFFTQLVMGRFLCNCPVDERFRYSEIIARDCAGVRTMFRFALKSVVPFVAFFYSFFLFDVYADAVGWKNALWASVLLTCLPLLVSLFRKVRQEWKDHNATVIGSSPENGAQSDGGDGNELEFSTVMDGIMDHMEIFARNSINLAMFKTTTVPEDALSMGSEYVSTDNPLQNQEANTEMAAHV